MALSTEYRGYRISYSENSDEWACFDLGKAVTSKSLSGCKAAIDKVLLGIRRKSSVSCLEIYGYSDRLEIYDATIIEYDGPRIEGGGWSNKPQYVGGHKVFAMAARNGSDRPSRQGRDLSSFAPICPETEAAIAVARQSMSKLKEAKAAYDAAVQAIPRLSLPDIAGLVEVSGIDPTGGLKQPKPTKEGT